MLSRREFVSLAAASAAAPRLASAQSAPPQAAPTGTSEPATGFYEKDNVRIRYQEIGSGFPLLVTPGGGLNSRISNWATAVFNAPEAFKNDFRVHHDGPAQRQWRRIRPGPIPVDDPWGAFADDQLGLMDHLGIRQVLLHRLLHRRPVCPEADGASARPRRRRSALPAGRTPAGEPGRHVQIRQGGLGARTPEAAARPHMETIEKYLHNLYRVQPDFVYSVSRDFVRNCQTPMLVMPDDTPAHPYQTSVDIASLAPNAEVTVYPWKEPPELKERTINRVRAFLKRHQPQTAAR